MLDAPTTDAGAVALALGAKLETGLSAQQALQALHENGSNELCATPRKTAWRRLLRQFQDPLIYLLLAAIAIALLAWVMDGSAGSAEAGQGRKGGSPGRWTPS